MDMNDEEIRHLADEDHNHAQGLLMTTGTPVGETVEGRDFFIVSTGAPFGAFNLGIVKPDGDDAEGAIARIEDYFGSRALPYRIQLRHDQLEAHQPGLLRSGYVAVEPTPAMVLRKITSAPAHAAGLETEILEPSDADAVAGFRSVVEEGFGMPAGMGAAAISDRVVSHPDTALILGCVDGVPVATTLLVMTNQVAGLYMVATSEAHRRRGYGAAVTWVGVEEGGRRGARFASLQASAMGRPVYERMGFETLSTYHAHASPGSDPAAGFGG